MTKLLHIDKNMDVPVSEAAGIIKDGGLVAFPTETVYGLGANALDAEAVQSIFTAKGRPPDNPLIVHIAEKSQVSEIAEVPVAAIPLMDTFWPGPLTLVMRKKENIPPVVTAGLDTVAVRMPAHPAALALIRAAGVPVAAPSANRSGRPSPTTAAHVLEDMDGLIPCILDGGSCRVGIESTVLDVSRHPYAILRPGDVTARMIEDVLGEAVELPEVFVSAEENGPVRSPGLKHTHYAPHAPMTVVTGTEGRIAAYIQRETGRGRKEGRTIGVLAAAETASRYQNARVLSLGSRTDPREMARNLFSALRRMDEWRVDAIYAEGIVPKGEGLAFMNRILRAAGFRTVDTDEEENP